MNLLLSIIGFCLATSRINAASITSRTGIESLPETANVSSDHPKTLQISNKRILIRVQFDDLEDSNPGVALELPTPYKRYGVSTNEDDSNH
jgi:hypothetical protein